MTLDELELHLRAWGRWYGERPTYDDEDGQPTSCGPGGYGRNPIAVSMEFAPRKRTEVLRLQLGRDGMARRRHMAAAVGIEGLEVLPAAFCDPVRGKDTKAPRNIARDWPVPPYVQRVQTAALNLHSIDTMRGICLRVHYCTLGDLEDKAAAATLRLGWPVKVRSYRDAVKEAKFWMLGRLSQLDVTSARA